MGRPNLERLREITRKRIAAKGVGREARKKKREDGASRAPAPPGGVVIREARSESPELPREPSVGAPLPLESEDQPSAEEVVEAGRVVAELVGALLSETGESEARQEVEEREETRGKAPVVVVQRPPRPSRKRAPPPLSPQEPLVEGADYSSASLPGRNQGEGTSAAAEAVRYAEGSDAAPASAEEPVVIPAPATESPVMPSGLALPEGWPEAHRPPGLSAEFSREEWKVVNASADAALGCASLVKLWKKAYRETEKTYRLVYAEAAFWKRAAARWEGECGPWAALADKRGKENDRLKDELSTVRQVAEALQQTASEQERDLKTFWQNYGALKAENAALAGRLDEARVEPNALRAELAEVQARLDASERGLAESAEVQAKLEVSEMELEEARLEVRSLALEKSKLTIDSDAALARKEEELKAATLRAEGAVEDRAVTQALLTDSRAAVLRLTAQLGEVSAEAKLASEAKDQEMATFKLSMEGRLEQAIAGYKASQAFQDELDESGSFSYELGFEDGLRQVRASYPNLDLSIVQKPGGEDEEDAGEDPSDESAGGDEGPLAPGGACA